MPTKSVPPARKRLPARKGAYRRANRKSRRVKHKDSEEVVEPILLGWAYH